jgi:glycogen debranching enzyme
MDTLERHGAVEIQSLWAEAFDRGDRVLGGGWGDLAAAVWESLETRYLKHEVFRDALDGPFKFSANSLVPVFFGQTSLGQRRRTLKRAREELVTPHGLRAASQKEAGQGYHERVWGLTTYWGMETLGAGVAEGYIKFMDSRTLYGMPETIAGGVPKGATHQLWSIAFLGGGQE